MLARLIAVFVLLPMVELALLIQIGEWIGLGPTLLLVIGTGVLGGMLARRQGLRAWLAIQNELRDGRIPGGALVDGLLILIGGILLLTPGVLTDLFGLSLLVPFSRQRLKRALARRFERAVQRGDSGFTVLFLR